MKILYHHRTLGDGAEGVHIREIVNAFEELGHEVEIAAPQVRQRSTGLASSQFGQTTRLTKRIAKQTAEVLYNFVVFFRVRRAIRRFQPDAIYERYSPFNFAGVLAAKRYRVPIVLEANATYAGIFGCRFPVYYPFLIRLAESYVLRKADGVVVVSESLKSCVVNVRDSGQPTVVSPNAVNRRKIAEIDLVDLRCMQREKLGVENDVVIGFVGSLRTWHGIDFLSEAIPRLARRHANLRFLIVGTGECEPILRKMIEDHDLHERITLAGAVPHCEIYGYVSAMDIGVMPDSNEFGSPMKILEYMAMECVPVAPDLSPMTEIIADFETGRIFERRNLESFVSTLDALCVDEAARIEIGRRARRYVLENRTWHHNARDAIKLLTPALELDDRCRAAHRAEPFQ